MRRSITLETYQKVKGFLTKHQRTPFTLTALRDSCNVDYNSVKLIMGHLIKEKTIRKRKNTYQFNNGNVSSGRSLAPAASGAGK